MQHSSSADLYDPLNAASHVDAPAEVDYSIPDSLVMVYPEDHNPQIVVRCATPREEDFVSFADSTDPNAPPTVATTIAYRDGFYEVVKSVPVAGRMEYHLGAWPEGEIHRRVITLSRAAEMQRRADEKAFARQVRMEHWMHPLYPFVGLLPREVQYSLASRYPIDLGSAVFWSCIVESVCAVCILFTALLLEPIAQLSEPNAAFLPTHILLIPSIAWIYLSPLLLVDALARWQILHRRGRIMGHVLLEGLWIIAHFRDEPKPSA